MSFITEHAETIGILVALLWNAFLQSTKAKK